MISINPVVRLGFFLFLDAYRQGWRFITKRKRTFALQTLCVVLRNIYATDFQSYAKRLECESPLSLCYEAPYLSTCLELTLSLEYSRKQLRSKYVRV